MYEVRGDEVVDDQIAHLPAHAQSGFMELRAMLEVAPWSGAPYTDSHPDSGLRLATFCHGDGLVSYMIREDDRLVDLLQVVYLG